MSFLLKLWQRKGSRYEQLLQDATVPSADSPSRTMISEIVGMLSGAEKDVHPQLAFATLISGINKSQNRHHWAFQLKNLLILSHCVDEHIFCRDIGGYPLSLMQHLPQHSFHSVNTKKLVQIFWRIIKHRAQFVASQSHLMAYQRTQRSSFLNELSSLQILEQMATLESFFRVCFDLIAELRSCGSKIQKYGLLCMLLKEVLSKCYQLYACQLQCFQQVLGKIGAWGVAELSKLKKACLKFESNSLHLMRLVEHYSRLKGLQGMNYTQLNPFPHIKVPQIIDQLIQQAEKHPPEKLCALNSDALEPIVVSLKPLSPIKRKSTLPRLSLSADLSSSYDPFATWESGFSDDFPPKDMLNLQMMELMSRIDQQKQSQMVYYDISTSGICTPSLGSDIEEGIEGVELMADMNFSQEAESVSQLHFQQPPSTEIIGPFRNVFSDLNRKWNE